MLGGHYVVIRTVRSLAATKRSWALDAKTDLCQDWGPVILTGQDEDRPLLAPDTLTEFDPLDEAVWDYPYPLYRDLRDRAPVSYNERRDFFAITRHEDVRAVLLDWEHFSSDARTYVSLWGPTSPAPGSLRESQLAMGRETASSTSLITLDPPGNRRLRDIATPGFGRAAMSTLEPRIRVVCEELVDRLVEHNRTGEADLVRDLGVPLPLTVTSAILGVPRADWEHVSHLISGAVELIGGGIGTGTRSPSPEALIQLHGYVGELADAKAGSDAGDLTAEHMRAVATGELTRDECVSQIMLMTMAGVATTTHLIGNFFKAMFEFPDALEALRADPAGIEAAVLEALRWESPVQAVFRIVRSDCELRGVSIPKASYVLAFIGSGNRDERRYVDPDVFLPARNPRDHLAFAPGVHNCLGGPLARLEARIAVEAILRRARRLELREPIVMVPNMALRGPRSVAVAFEAAE